MNPTLAAVLQIAALIVVLAVVHKPLGAYMAGVYTGVKHRRAERVAYKLTGVDPDADQRWPVYLRSVLAFSAISVLFLYGLQRLQHWLPLNIGMKNVDPFTAWNTAASFVTNTNWQSYSGEAVMGHLVQMAGLAVQNFVSAAVGMAVAIALIRGLTRSKTDRLGNFWVDLVRGSIRILLPLAFIGAIVLIAFGAIENFSGGFDAHAVAGGTQHVTGGPVASQESIKELGTNGGGFYNANSAHPFEDPSAFTSWFEILLILVIPFSLPYMFGRMVGDQRQGYAVVAAMAVICLGAMVSSGLVESHHLGPAPQAAGAAMEGKETRFGVPLTSLFSVSTTMTSTGAVNGQHDSLTALGGGIALFDMHLGEITPGGVGSGLYGILVMAVLAVFLAGLMVGRTPEYLGKRIGAREMKLVGLYILIMPATVLFFTGLAAVTKMGVSSTGNPGPHGLSEMLYAFTSAANNNGSAFGGLTASTPFYNIGTGLSVLLGRFVPMVFLLGLAGSLAKQRKTAPSVGTMPTHTPLFTVVLIGVIIIVAGLTFLPALALGPLAEGLS